MLVLINRWEACSGNILDKPASYCLVADSDFNGLGSNAYKAFIPKKQEPSLSCGDLHDSTPYSGILTILSARQPAECGMRSRQGIYWHLSIIWHQDLDRRRIIFELCVSIYNWRPKTVGKCRFEQSASITGILFSTSFSRIVQVSLEKSTPHRALIRSTFSFLALRSFLSSFCLASSSNLSRWRQHYTCFFLACLQHGISFPSQLKCRRIRRLSESRTSDSGVFSVSTSSFSLSNFTSWTQPFFKALIKLCRSLACAFPKRIFAWRLDCHSEKRWSRRRHVFCRQVPKAVYRVTKSRRIFGVLRLPSPSSRHVYSFALLSQWHEFIFSSLDSSDPAGVGWMPSGLNSEAAALVQESLWRWPW